MIKKIVLMGGVILSLLTSSCNLNESSTIQVKFVNDILKGSDILEESRAIALSAKHDDALIVGINKLLIGENRYFVMDRYGNQLMAFDENGEFVATTKRLEGEGPDNYIRIADAVIDNSAQKVYVHCDAPYCMMVFDMNLRLLEKVSLDYYMSEIADDDKYIYGIRMKLAPDSGYELLALDKKDLSAEPVTIVESSKGIYGYLASGRNLTSSKRGINAGLPYDNTIYRISDKKITASYRMDFGSLGVGYDDIKDMSAEQFSNSPYREKVWSIVDVYASDSMLVFGCGSLYRFVLNTLSGECMGFSSSRNDMMPYSNTQTIPVDGPDNAYAYSCPSKHVMRFKEHLRKKMDARMRKILDDYDEEGNPVVILCELR